MSLRAKRGNLYKYIYIDYHVAALLVMTIVEIAASYARGAPLAMTAKAFP